MFYIFSIDEVLFLKCIASELGQQRCDRCFLGQWSGKVVLMKRRRFAKQRDGHLGIKFGS